MYVLKEANVQENLQKLRDASCGSVAEGRGAKAEA